MANNALFSILALPQEFKAGKLRFNLVFIPRNISPLLNLNTYNPAIDVDPFAEAGTDFKLNVKLISGLSGLPAESDVSFEELLTQVSVPNSAIPIFKHLQQEFQIDDIPSNDQKAPPTSANRYIKKYLPQSYRKAFNFTNPRTKDAVTDDSYHCAFKDSGINPNFKQSPNRISWGKVYAYCLRHPELAKAVGLIHSELEVDVPSGMFQDGGWLYVDFNSSVQENYFAKQIVGDDTLARRYAARIPPMEDGDSRTLFAMVLFPVEYSAAISGNFDEPLRNAADYDDGFAKIVHGFQPISTNFLQEEETDDMILPTKDSGFRLSWDDETVLELQNRQLKPDSSVPGNERLDLPLGVFNYKIDVREKLDGTNAWHSLNRVSPKQSLELAGELIMGANSETELGTEVYPMQLDGDPNKNYWLPAYFTQWTGKSMVLPDEDAAEIYRVQEETREYIDADGPSNPKRLKVQLSKKYDALGLDQIQLTYGKTYEFRVRMGDVSGGGPGPKSERIFEAIAKDTSLHFRRHVAPNAIRMEELPENNNFFGEDSLVLRRPIMEYPNIEFTGKYNDVVKKLIQHGKWAAGKTGIGLPDPDVNDVEITVEVKALNMDNKASVTGRESYIKLYTTTRKFNDLDFDSRVGTVDATDPFVAIEKPLEVPLHFIDVPVLDFDNPDDFGYLGLNPADLDDPNQIVLPTARDIRVTLKGIGEDDDSYFGLNAWKRGKTIQFHTRKASSDERNLFDPAFLNDQIEGYYLQADIPIRPSDRSFFIGRVASASNTSIQRLADKVDLESKGMSLIGREGVRVQFGCSRRIRHSLAPDGTGLTFSAKTDLFNHWLVALNFRLQRDWTWAAMELESFVVTRRKKFSQENDWKEQVVGIINLNNTINIQALQKPDRSFTQLVFVDAVEPKSEAEFPDTIDLEYILTPKFKAAELPTEVDTPETLDLTLPVTVNPAQEPEIVSAGIALSPYIRDEKYANTEPRKRHLWIELKEPVADPNDGVFIRFLSYAPDPLLSDLLKYPELLEASPEPALPIDPELIRVIRPGQSDDNAGLSAMTELVPANTEPGKGPRHFIVPLPPGLHPESEELFGFFTYELRIGHNKIWSTAQGRFGRPLRVTGVQHPAPTLFCTAERTDKAIKVVATYATAVQNGKNVTAKPPRTELWCLLYAQVKLANNQDFRNILLGEAKLSLKRRERTSTLGISHHIEPQALQLRNKDAKLYGSVTFDQKGIQKALANYGLPGDSNLSVLCVEMMPTNYRSYVTYNQAGFQKILTDEAQELFGRNVDLGGIRVQDGLPEGPQNPKPLSDHLGHFRIMRTSPLIEVPEVCCVDC